MDNLAHTTESPVFVPGLPRVDRYFPQCMCGAVEAAAKLRFGSNDFGKIYGRHTFDYQRPPGPIRFRDNGVEVDIQFYRVEVPEGHLESLIESIYGVRIEPKWFGDFGSYWDYCRKELRSGVPVVTDFDLFGIKERREYGKLHSSHVVVLTGYDMQQGIVTAGEMVIGPIAVSFADFRGCIEYKVGAAGGVGVFEVRRLDHGERDLTREEVLARIEENLANLTSESESSGLRALERYRSDIAEYLAGPDWGERPFWVPGVWVFSHERYMERKWLKAVRHLCGAGNDALFEDFDATLERLFKVWLNGDYLMEKCLNSGNGKALRALPDYLSQIIVDERRATESWKALHELVSRA